MSALDLVKEDLHKQYSQFHKGGKQRLKRHPYLIPVSGLILGFVFVWVGLIFSGGQTVQPTDLRVVNLFIDGKEQTLPTRAGTVGSLVDRLDLELLPEDIVEPARDTEILTDDFTINVYRAKPTLIVDGTNKAFTLTAHKSPTLIAKSAGLKVYPEDNANFQPGDIKEGMLAQKIVIDRATAVNFNLYGTPLVLRTHVDTVGELLQEKNVKMQADDTVQPSSETPLTEGLQVFIIRKGTQVVTQEEVIPKPIEFKDNPNLPRGSVQVESPGSDGKKVVTYELQMENGVEKGRKVIQEVIATPAVKEVRIRGTKQTVATYVGDKAAVMGAAGISADQHYYADYVIGRESGWRLNARNPSGCLGLGQACPGSKLVNACPAWESDAVCQLSFFSGYANGRYGSWQGAYNFWLAHHWW